MGLFDVLLGKRRLAKPAADRLFAMATAQITLETQLNLKTTGEAGIVFKPLDTADFKSIVKEAQELLATSSAESGTKIENRDDKFGYCWIAMRDKDFEDLVTSVNLVSEELQAGGYGEQILCAVFPFRDERKRPAYWIYNYKRGKWYPFVPKPDAEQARDTEREFRLSSAIGSELPTEPELERWFPLWGIPI